jgi:hypothetical protein
LSAAETSSGRSIVTFIVTVSLPPTRHLACTRSTASPSVGFARLIAWVLRRSRTSFLMAVNGAGEVPDWRLWCAEKSLPCRYPGPKNRKTIRKSHCSPSVRDRGVGGSNPLARPILKKSSEIWRVQSGSSLGFEARIGFWEPSAPYFKRRHSGELFDISRRRVTCGCFSPRTRRRIVTLLVTRRRIDSSSPASRKLTVGKWGYLVKRPVRDPKVAGCNPVAQNSSRRRISETSILSPEVQPRRYPKSRISPDSDPGPEPSNKFEE